MTFDSKYEKIEIPGSHGAAATGGRSGRASVGRTPADSRSGTPRRSTQVTRKPVVSSNTPPRRSNIRKGSIEQAAFFQNQTDQKAAGGITVPGVDDAANAKDPGGLAAPGDNPSLELGTSTAEYGITLDQAINQTLIADPVIHAGLEVINQTNADVLTASLAPNPELFTDGQLMPLSRPFTVTRQGGPPQFDVIVTYPIDWFLFGKRAAAMQAASLSVQISQSEYQDLIRTRVLEASTAFYDILEAKALRDVASQDSKNFQRIEELTAAAVENGGRPAVELNRVRLDRLRSEQSLRDAENALAAATARLRVLLGRDDTDPSFDVIGTLEAKEMVEPMPIEDAIVLADQNRPDLEAARWKIAQADATAELERRKAFPTVVPGLGYTRQYQEKAVGFPDADSWLANLTMSVPIFDRNQGNRSKAASLATQASFQLQARRVALRGEVVQATQELNTSAANAKAVAQGQLEVARQVRNSINSAYEAGGQPLIDVLDAQRNYRETYRLFITSRANYHRAAIRYNATLGQQVGPQVGQVNP